MAKRMFMTEFSARVGLHPNTIKAYEKQGVVVPERVGHCRVFTERDAQRVQAHRQKQVNGKS